MEKVFTILFFTTLALLPVIAIGQQQQQQQQQQQPQVAPYYYKPAKSGRFLLELNDAQLDIGLQTVTMFALDDRASLSANPHFEAMWNLVRLGATLETLLRGDEDVLNDVDMNKKFGRNGYNKTVLMLFARYGFGESSDVKLQRHFFELGVSPGFFKQGKKGTHIHLDFRTNIARTPYGAGGGSIDRTFDYEIFGGMRMGFDWSFSRSESESGFFAHLNDELKRIAYENDFTASELIMLEDLAESSRVLLPEDVGGRAFHFGPIAGARI
ncbi:MAG: hypothetical protein HUU34_17755, partial [Saprospiraceae bacterium]|nr:hypothetical protein [Saprospiraceae bacterium]